MIPRRIIAVRDESEAACVVDLDCGHSRHVRDRPPLESYPWVRDPDARRARVGTSIECGRCDAFERPVGAQRYREGPEWNAATVPAGLLKRHELKAGVWGELTVVSGRVRMRYHAPIDRVVELGVGDIGIVPPEVPHELEILGDAVVRLDFYR